MVQRDKANRMDSGRFWPGISLSGLFKRRNYPKRAGVKINYHLTFYLLILLISIINAQEQRLLTEVEKYAWKLDTEAQEAFYEKRYQLAADNWEKCVQIYEERGDSTNIARIDVKRSKTYYKIGNFYRTFQALNRARLIYKKLKNDRELIFTIKEIARNYFGISDYFPTIRYYQEALEIAKKNDWNDEIIQTQAGIGQAYYMLGQYTQARKLYYQTFPYVQSENQKWWFARIITYLGILNFYDFHLDSAQIFFNRATQIQKEIDDERGLKDNYLNLGIIAYNQNELKNAESFLLKSLALQQKLKDENGEIITNLRLGEVNYQRMQFDQARFNFTTAYDIAKKISDRILQATSLNKLSYLDYSQGAYGHAMKILTEALEIASRINDPNLLWRIYYSMGLVTLKEQRYSQAFQYYRYAMNSIELTEPEKSFMIQPSEFSKSEIDVFNDAIKTATILAKNMPEKDWLSVLFKTSERLHVRKLFYALLNLDIQLADSILGDKIHEIRTNNQQLRAIQKLLLDEKRTDLLNQNVSRVVSLMAYQETIQMKLQDLRGELNVRYPNFKNFFAYPATSFEEIQGSLSQGQVLLKYVPLEKTLVILQIQADTSFFYEVNISSNDLKELNQKFYETVHSLNEGKLSAIIMEQNLNTLTAILKKLSDQLLSPVKKTLSNCNELIILSAPCLAGLPFETLFWDNETQEYLIEKLPVRYISVGQVIPPSFYHNPKKPIDFTSINGEKKNTYKQKFYETNKVNYLQIDFNQTNSNKFTLLSQLKKRTGLIHFEISGKWHAPEPSNSFLNLKVNQNAETLYQAQWFNLQFDESTLLMFTNFLIIPEFENQNYFLLYDVLKMLGSHNFLVSHWPLPAEIAPRFINNLVEKLKHGSSVSQALQIVKKDILSKNEYRHPFYWAALQYIQ
ncbi:tetratricopeptide repeat protein [candidate division KSB1 bacterium]|nr:tetratricopeptide repeat protein [candidate division KSB1 bacterium]